MDEKSQASWEMLARSDAADLVLAVQEPS
jgi:hypothetical protein